MERLTVKWKPKSYDMFDPVDVADNEYSKINFEKWLTKLGEYEDLEEQCIEERRMSMTESEALEWFKGFYNADCEREDFENTICADCMFPCRHGVPILRAISALEEVQQLHAIGTVSEFRELKEKKHDCDIKHLFGECSYAETGCSDCVGKLRIKEVLEKATAKNPTDVRYFGEAGYYIGLCPTCKNGNNSEYEYCGDCGQKLQWFERSKGKE